MIKTETVTMNNREFKRTYSDENRYIRKIGTDEVYTEAVDVITSTYEYEETDDIIETGESESTNEDAEAILALIERGDI